MEISLNRQEYRALLECLCIARWVASSNRSEGAELKLRPLHSIEDKVCRLGAENGCGDLVEYDEEYGGYYPTKEFEGASLAKECMEVFEDQFFWNELVLLLSNRDIERMVPKTEWDALSRKEQDRRREEIADRYWKAFHGGGLKRLELISNEIGG